MINDKNQKTFVQSLEGWTSGPLDKCFLLKDKKKINVMFSLGSNAISLSPNDKCDKCDNKSNKTKNISKKFGRPDLWTNVFRKR
jgi:hypothetical protein